MPIQEFRNNLLQLKIVSEFRDMKLEDVKRKYSASENTKKDIIKIENYTLGVVDLAIITNHQDVLEWCKHQGFDITLSFLSDIQDTIQLALIFHPANIVKSLVKLTEVKLTHNHLKSAILYSNEENRLDIIKYLCTNGVDVTQIVPSVNIYAPLELIIEKVDECGNESISGYYVPHDCKTTLDSLVQNPSKYSQDELLEGACTILYKTCRSEFLQSMGGSFTISKISISKGLENSHLMHAIEIGSVEVFDLLIDLCSENVFLNKVFWESEVAQETLDYLLQKAESIVVMKHIIKKYQKDFPVLESQEDILMLEALTLFSNNGNEEVSLSGNQDLDPLDPNIDTGL